MTRVESQVAALEKGLYGSLERGTALLIRMTDDVLWRSPTPGRWSAGECIAHLNLSNQAMFFAMETALKRGGPAAPSKPYRLDFLGWILVKSMEPKQRMRLKTQPSFVPKKGGSVLDLRAEFSRLIQLLVAVARRGTEVDLGKVRMQSPFRSTWYYSVFSGLRITEVHLRRHLLQAEESAALVAAHP